MDPSSSNEAVSLFTPLSVLEKQSGCVAASAVVVKAKRFDKRLVDRFSHSSNFIMSTFQVPGQALTFSICLLAYKYNSIIGLCIDILNWILVMDGHFLFFTWSNSQDYKTRLFISKRNRYSNKRVGPLLPQILDFHKPNFLVPDVVKFLLSYQY